MQQQVHGAQTRCVVHDLPPTERLVSPAALLIRVEIRSTGESLVGRQEEAALAARWVTDRHPWLGPYHLDQWRHRSRLSRPRFHNPAQTTIIHFRVVKASCSLLDP
jgi:hypothetical protein